MEVLLSHLGPLIVGTLLVLAGLLKALDNRHFVAYLSELQLFPGALLSAIGRLLVFIETLAGTALILNVYRAWGIPISLMLLVLFCAVTIWMSQQQGIRHCRCYGGLLLLTPRQSILLGVGCLCLLAISWTFLPAAPVVPEWKFYALGSILGITLGFLLWSERFYIRNGKTLSDVLSPLKPGRKWKASWVSGDHLDTVEGAHFLVFLQIGCTGCSSWLTWLDEMHQQPGMPHVIGFSSALEVFGYEEGAASGLEFPINEISERQLERLVFAYPTGVLIEEGVIQDVWVGEFPPEFLQRLGKEKTSVDTPQVPVAIL